MIDLFSAIRGMLKVNEIVVDNLIFKLHYKITGVILLGCSLMVTARQYIGDPIDCIVHGMPSNIMDTYCWITATFTLPDRLDGRPGVDMVQPGVAAGGESVKYHKYYQWVCFVLFFQAMFFYGPRYLWKMWEGGRVASLAIDLKYQMCDEARAERLELIVKYFANNMNALNTYAMRFFACEFLNLVNIAAQIYFLDYFLEGEFRTYGLQVLQFSEEVPENRVDPMARIFPKVTKCTFYQYGWSGTIQNMDGLCVLPINVVNEKIFVFLWFWFWIVAALSVLNTVYRIVVLLRPKFRLLLLRSRARLASKRSIKTIMGKSQIGSWFLLYQLGKNIDSVVYKELITNLANELDKTENPTLLP